MAPVLFLFLMDAFAKLLEKTWERENMEKITFKRESDDTYRKGQVFRQEIKKCDKSTTLTFVQVLLAMYVDDMAIPFASRQQLCKGMPLVQQLLSNLGLEMHMENESVRIHTKFLKQSVYSSPLLATSKICSKVERQLDNMHLQVTRL